MAKRLQTGESTKPCLFASQWKPLTSGWTGDNRSLLTTRAMSSQAVRSPHFLSSSAKRNPKKRNITSLNITSQWRSSSANETLDVGCDTCTAVSGARLIRTGDNQNINSFDGAAHLLVIAL